VFGLKTDAKLEIVVIQIVKLWNVVKNGRILAIPVY